MDEHWLLTSGFTVSDGQLTAAQLNQLSTAAELLRTPIPRELDPVAPTARKAGSVRQSTTQERLDAAAALRSAQSRRDQALAKRSERLREALKIAESLLEPTHTELSVLCVYLRAKVEAEGICGVRFSLFVLARALDTPWEGLGANEDAEDAPSAVTRPARADGVKRWTAQLDTVLEQVYSWCARSPKQVLEGSREPPRSTTSCLLSHGVSLDFDWGALQEALSFGLQRRRLVPKRWVEVNALMDELKLTNSSLSGAAEATSTEATSTEADEAERAAVSQVTVRKALSQGQTRGTTADGAESEVTLRVSAQFVQLRQRLAAFNQLLRDGQYARASLVAVDLQRTLEAFDVAAYFPGLFAEFFVGCAEHAAELAQFSANQDDPRWQALSRLYQTDLHRFLNLRSPAEAASPVAARVKLG